MLKKILIMAASLGAISCVTVEEDKEAPKIVRSMPAKEIFDIALKHGGDSMKSLKKVSTKANKWPQMAQLSRDFLAKNIHSADRATLIRTAQVYQAAVPELEAQVLRLFTRHEKQDIAVIAWQLASIRPSAPVKRFIEEEVSFFLVRNWESRLLFPEFARAVQENEVNSVFSLLRMGLMENKGDDFAKAMLALNSRAVAEPFMDYLGTASVEDLRQMNQTTVDVYTCLVILRHFMANSLPVGHPDVGRLFVYAVSRNSALADMAREVIDQQLPQFKEQLTFALAKQPMKVQIAFVEGVRRSPGSNFRILLGQLRGVTRYSQVVEEIDTIKSF